MENTIDIGNRLEPLWDDFLIDSMEGCSIQPCRPVPAPLSGLPRKLTYATMVKEKHVFRCYGRMHSEERRSLHDGDDSEFVAMFESKDGVEWTAPELGIYEIDGTYNNNAVLAHASPFCHNFSPFLDTNPDRDSKYAYKALAGESLRNKKLGHFEKHDLYPFGSPDGTHWETIVDRPVIGSESYPHAFDSQNLAFWSEAEGCYVCFFRSWHFYDKDTRYRSISKTTSSDFLHWTDPVDLHPNKPGEHLYTSQTSPYLRAPHIYTALPTRFMDDRGSTTDILLFTMRAGEEKYNRLSKGAYIRPGIGTEFWGNRSNYAALNLLRTGSDELSIYLLCKVTPRRYVLRLDGLASLHSDGEGRMITKPLRHQGKRLLLNYSTSAAGSVSVEVLDGEGHEIPQFSGDNRSVLIGDEIGQCALWEKHQDNEPAGGIRSLDELGDQPIRLRFALEEADIYSIKFVP